MNLICTVEKDRRKNAKRVVAIVISSIFAAAIFWTPIPDDSVIVLLITAATIFAILTTFAILKRKKRIIVRVATFIWNQPIILPIFLVPTIFILILAVQIIHMGIIGNQITSPGGSQPWQKELPARVYWNGQPNPDMEQGLADTARLLGFRYEEATTAESANIQIWPNSWMYFCPWLETAAFVSLDPDPTLEGAQKADIYICRFTPPWNKKVTDHSLMAHEAAHVFAEKGHFGEGLMATGGGDGSLWFSKAEIKELCRKINEFHNSVKPAIQDLNKENSKVTAENDRNKAQCGSEKPPQE